MQYACMLPCMTAGPSSTACTGPIPAVDAASTTLGELIDVEASAKFAGGAGHHNGLHIRARVRLPQAVEERVEHC